EDAAEVEHEAQREPGLHQPEALERGLRENERLGVFERDDVRRPRKPVEEADLAEEVARLEHADELRAVAGRHEHFERAPRDDEEAAVELARVNRELTRA